MRDDVGRYRAMLRIRRFEERCVELYSAQHIRGFMHLGIGQEAVAVGVIDALRPDDRVVGTYRDHAHALAKGVPMDRVMAEMFGMSEGCSGGRGGSMHLFDVEHGLFGGNAIVAGGLPLAVGLALGDQMCHRDLVTVCFFGDGAMAEGEFHESINLAALWQLPVLFVCENNLYAMGTALAVSHASTDLAGRAATYGVVAGSVDGMDVTAVSDAAAVAVDAIRGGGGPQFLEAHTYRLRAHSMYDPERYRTRDEVALWRERDPLPRYRRHLESLGTLDTATLDALDALDVDVDAEVDAAVEFARSGTPEPVEDLLVHVTAEAPR
jgi:pyruvate dehydrogenase E1 component alpha subunit